MANALDQNPLIIDTQMTEAVKKDQLDAAVTVWDGAFRISKIYWLQPTTIGDLMVMKNKASGKVIAKMRCEVADQSQYLDFDPQLVTPDIIVDDLDSGVVYIYLVPRYLQR